MNPTPMPSPAMAPTPAQLASARAELSQFTTGEQRDTFAHGYLQSALTDAARHITTSAARDALGRALAILEALEDGSYDYHREDPVIPGFVDPPGVEGWAVGRVTR